MPKSTIYLASDFPICCDCDGPTGAWWVERSGYETSGSAVRRCHSCYLAYCRERYQRQQRAAGRVAKSHDQSRAERSAARRRVCPRCDAEFDARANGSKYCSDVCAAQERRDRNRRKNTKRRTAMRVVESEDYSLVEIAERDGWRCHLCRGRVDPKLSGMHRMGPTIDHLVPLSADGADVRANVSLAHRSCNCRRGAGGVAQLRLAV